MYENISKKKHLKEMLRYMTVYFQYKLILNSNKC